MAEMELNTNCKVFNCNDTNWNILNEAMWTVVSLLQMILLSQNKFFDIQRTQFISNCSDTMSIDVELHVTIVSKDMKIFN